MTSADRANQETDVLIIGAGPTGLLIANLLGTMGVRTTIIERNAHTVQEPRAVSIDDESMRALQAAGLAEAVTQITVRGYGSIYRGPSGKVFATVKPSARDYGFEKRNAFQQPEFEALLRRALDRFDCLTPMFGTELTAFAQTEDGVSATVRTTGGERRIAARYMVACDGGRSFVRKSLNIEMRGSTFREPWLIVDLNTTRNRCFHTEVACDPARPFITLPGPDGMRRYEFKLRPDEDPETAVQEDFARALLADTGPDGQAELRRVQVYTFHARIAERWRDGRVFLAGDAAHLTPPFAGQGMNSGLRDAHNLAWKLHEALASGGAIAVLESYESERSPHAWSMILLALRMGQVMMPSSRLQGAAVRGAFHLLGLYPPVRNYFAQMRYKPKPRFTGGLIWPRRGTPDRTVVGRMLPQPLVETAERRRVLMDEILPDRPVVLVYSERPEAAVDPALKQAVEAAGACIVGITPEWMNPSQSDFPIVRDQSRLLSELPYRSCLEHAFLLRRDRYIAGIRPLLQLNELQSMLSGLSAPDDPQALAAGQKETTQGEDLSRRLAFPGRFHCGARGDHPDPGDLDPPADDAGPVDGMSVRPIENRLFTSSVIASRTGTSSNIRAVANSSP